MITQELVNCYLLQLFEKFGPLLLSHVKEVLLTVFNLIPLLLKLSDFVFLSDVKLLQFLLFHNEAI